MADSGRGPKTYTVKSSGARSSKGKKPKKGGKGKIPVILIIVLILALGAGGGIFYAVDKEGATAIFNQVFNAIAGDKDAGNQKVSDKNSDSGNDSDNNSVINADNGLTVHFLELGNKYTGDCTLIKIGNTEVLIDAGSRQNSAKAIKEYVDNYCTDGILEYVIATHAHQDHIAGFVGTADKPGIFDSYICKTIIDFPKTNADSSIYSKYVEKRESEKSNGAKHYTALDCYNNVNGGNRVYTLAEGVTMSILYQEFYEEETDDENDYSVCVLISNGGVNYLFTGDLEADGEESLVANNSLPKCKLFKGAHHGSYTASTNALLSVIQPEVVCVCCCCGSDEYTDVTDNMFPSKAFVDRVSVYTDKIYVTSIVADNEAGYTSLNGNIVVSCTADGILNVNCSNNNTIFKETAWFKQNRE